MIRFSVLYPATSGSHFHFDYYLGKHLEIAKRLLLPLGLVRIEVDRGVAGFPPGSPALYHAIGHLIFPDITTCQSALAATAAELIADVPNYTDSQAVIQVSEIV
jgi:uncharacterized protein (TIGR02118 family)